MVKVSHGCVVRNQRCVTFTIGIEKMGVAIDMQFAAQIQQFAQVSWVGGIVWPRRAGNNQAKIAPGLMAEFGQDAQGQSDILAPGQAGRQQQDAIGIQQL